MMHKLTGEETAEVLSHSVANFLRQQTNPQTAYSEFIRDLKGDFDSLKHGKRVMIEPEVKN